MRAVIVMLLISLSLLHAGCRTGQSWLGRRERITIPSRDTDIADSDTSPASATTVEVRDEAETPNGSVPRPLPAEETPIAHEIPKEADPFDPAPLSPLSPAAMLRDATIPKAYEARLDELQRVGQKLAEAQNATGVTFAFDTVYNPRKASTCHTDAGHVLVTSSLLEQVTTRHQLAAALALEMAELVEETKTRNEKAQATQAGVPEPAVALNVAPDEQEKRVASTAANLLAAAGFEAVDLVAARADLAALNQRLASTADPKWTGPKPAAAN